MKPARLRHELSRSLSLLGFLERRLARSEITTDTAREELDRVADDIEACAPFCDNTYLATKLHEARAALARLRGRVSETSSRKS